MNKILFGLLIVFISIISMSGYLSTQELKNINLNPPDKKPGLPFMEALSVKAFTREWSEKELSLQDLSDLLWATNGIKRPKEKKTTASSAQNAHDVDIYVFMKEDVYMYDVYNHKLNPALSGDLWSQIITNDYITKYIPN